MGGRPGDDYNGRGDVRELLMRHGWTCVGGGGNECWRRPGKDQGWSATFRDRVFYVFSSNAAPFEPNHAYSPFAVYCIARSSGRIWRQRPHAAGRRDLVAIVITRGMDLSRIVCHGPPSPTLPPRPEHPDPGPASPELFRVPGFVSEVMDHCLATAPYPNVPLAFCGALALQAVLAGRKVPRPCRQPQQPLRLGAGLFLGRQGLAAEGQHVRAAPCRTGGVARREVRLGRGDSGFIVPYAEPCCSRPTRSTA